MKKLHFFTTICILLISINSIAQNVGINNTNPQAALDVQGDLRLRSATLTLPAAVNNNVDITTQKSSVYMFAGGALTGCQITGFNGGIDGRIITIFNNSTTNAIQLYDETNPISASSTAANRILTGTGNSAIIYGNGSVSLRYDAGKVRWVVMSSTYTDGLSASPSPWLINANNITNSNSGNVGIGNNAPAYKLDVKTTANSAISTYTLSEGEFGYGLIGRNNNKGIGILGEAYQGSAVGGYFIADGNGTETALKAETLNGGTAAYLNSPTGKALIVNQGNVGIGEPAPLEKLHVNSGNIKIGNAAWGSAADDKFLKIGDANFVTIGEVGADDKMEIKANEVTIKAVNGNVLIPFGNVGINAGATSLYNKLQIGNPPAFAGNDIAIGNGTQGMSLFQSTGSSIWYSNTNFSLMPAGGGTGNVGIGTLNPTYKLSVNGSIRSKEVVVETGWADYVFAKDYKLPSLTEVEKYIKANNHLPEIPSAKEIQENGLKVGEVQTKMMQKIEELTLYVIEQNKRIEELEKKLKSKN